MVSLSWSLNKNCHTFVGIVHLTNDKLECAFMGKVVAATNKMAIQQSNHTHKFIPRMDQKGQNER